MTPSASSSWEERFLKIYYERDKTEVLEFIRQEIASARREAREEVVEEIKSIATKMLADDHISGQTALYGHNTALLTLIAKLAVLDSGRAILPRAKNGEITNDGQ